ncbi:hypothetical protein F511_34881 [Dorcoceras hygrometricum]|uniref:Uncharacterized protein n=1 Tax=Dorcoceras hygrometricum TaxID=472368 RepID=A0A2Z7C1M8_9LAMI|nr:hypothetical protein F511_34881 [Dorcoceras hygrometricum]
MYDRLISRPANGPDHLENSRRHLGNRALILPDRPWMLHKRLRYDITRVMVFLKNTNSYPGPNLSYTWSYTSILRLVLAVGDTPDTSGCHLGTRGQSCTLYTTKYVKDSGRLPEEKVTPPKVRPIHISLGSKITGDYGDNLAQNNRQSEGDLSHAKCSSAPCAGQRVPAYHTPVDWAVKMRIRPPELDTSICDAKYHVSLVGNIGML